MKENWDKSLTAGLYFTVFYNILGAFAFAFPAVLQTLLRVPAPSHPIYNLATAAVVGAFGWGYYWQARAARRDRVFLKTAALGKVGFFAVIFGLSLQGALPWFAPVLASGDLLLAGLFVGWLRRNPVPENTVH